IVAGLVRLGLVAPGAGVAAERLTGGVSSDIWKVAAGGRTFCVKRAMGKLAVKDDWFVPVERNRYERLWYETAGARVPGVAPRVLAADDAAGFFAMDWLDPADHRLWKAELLAARVDIAFAVTVGRQLAAVHGATAGDAGIAAAFPTGALFEALRLDPYLRATGRRHPDLAAALDRLADRTAATNVALVHGDVSPKNIMAGPAGPVFLDAECAWYGDPAFDLAFCLNHLLLKGLARPDAAAAFLASFDALRDAYLGAVAFEPASALEARAAALLPGLFLARVDGKSPVEYVVTDAARDMVRRVAIPFVREPPARLAAVRDAWAREIGAAEIGGGEA
ncbi:MAG TPA: phosphotransferase, partial [Bauldia sp.]|nr:phosphotransferase [Bauldia sp.]